MRQEFGIWLKKEIKRSGRTQAEFAALINIEQPHLSRIINGTRGASDQVLENIGTVLGIPKEIIYQHVGLLRPPPEKGPLTRHAERLLSGLPPDKQQQAINFIEFLANQQELEDNQGKINAAKPLEQSE